jgi:predicted permease
MPPGPTLRLASYAYREVAFQAIHALRQGNTLAPAESDRDLVAKALRRVTQSKMLLTLLIVFLNLGVFVGLRLGPGIFLADIPTDLYDVGLISALLLLELSLLWMTGVQILPTLVASKVFQTLASLPLTARQIDRVALVVLLRLFDIPGLTALVLTPISIGWALHSLTAGVLLVPGVVVMLSLSIGLALATGRFFARRVQGARGGGRSTLVRWSLLVLWALPAFAIYALVSFSPELLRGLKALALAGPGGPVEAIALLFPFPFAELAAHAAAPGSLSFLPQIPVIAGAIVYVLLALYIGSTIISAPRRLAELSPEAGPVDATRRFALRHSSPSGAVLVKDLRTASRTPGYAFLVLLPLLDALVLALSSYVGTPRPNDVFNLAAVAVATAALLATFFGPAFFATEVMGYSYTRALPLSRRALLWGKASLVLLIYLVASALVLGATLARIFTPLLFLAFVLAEFPGVAAAIFLELGVIARYSEKRGIPLTNLYTGAWWATAVVIPGLAVAALPLGVFLFLHASGGAYGTPLVAMALAAIAELALCAPFALGLPGRGGR